MRREAVRRSVLGEDASRIIAIGDTHGDYALTIKYLKDIAKVIDDDLNWIGEDTVIVQLGDQIDRCRPSNGYSCCEKEATPNDEASDVKILLFFSLLHREAQKKGGAVYSILGNHEIMNVQGNMNYVSYEGFREFDGFNGILNGEKARIEAFKPGGCLAKYLGCTRNSSMIIGSWLFVHAGISKKLAEMHPDLSDINDLIRRWLIGKVSDENIDSILNSYEVSPFWPRIFGNLPNNLPMESEKCQESLKPTLQLFNVNNMVIGHTPQFYANECGISNTCGESLWRVDTGSSKAFDVFNKFNKRNENRNPQVLEILNDTQVNILG